MKAPGMVREYAVAASWGGRWRTGSQRFTTAAAASEHIAALDAQGPLPDGSAQPARRVMARWVSRWEPEGTDAAEQPAGGTRPRGRRGRERRRRRRRLRA